MPDMNVRIACSIRGANPTHIDQTIIVSQKDLEQFIPPTPSGNAGTWPHVGEAEGLVCSILKEELFPDEVTPIQDVKDLRRIGVTSLTFSFENKERGMIGTTSIHPD